ncbi:MAG TPA: CHAT domain-containing protein, partial [Candidatus Saccharimonadales bacterium]|nr:CHAT domain-containing protein [Candidatus Saccharimonadales bacterium]
QSPLLLSGLAMAGANAQRTGADGEDGVLTAEEIASLDLSGVDLAVLSACDTGVGTIMAGEGVFGLRRAMQVAGVRSLVLSLWSVDDESTRRWMEAFYEGMLSGGMDVAAAARSAGRSVLETRRRRGDGGHPFFWGAFVTTGT